MKSLFKSSIFATICLGALILIIGFGIDSVIDKKAANPLSPYSRFDALDKCSVFIRNETIPYDCATLTKALEEYKDKANSINRYTY